MTDTLASLRDQVEHLRFMLDEITSPPPEWTQTMARVGVSLSPCQSRVLGALVHAKGAIVTRESLLAATIWDRQAAEPEIKVVDVYISHVRRKLREAGVPGEIMTVWGVGYRWQA